MENHLVARLKLIGNGSGDGGTLKMQRRLSRLLAVPQSSWRLSDRIFYRAARLWLFTGFPAKYHGYLGAGATIGEGLRLPHSWYGIFIDGAAVIGRNCTIYQHVTIGAWFEPDGKRKSPRIGNNVLIGAGAELIGSCEIGNGAKIGAGVTLVDAVVQPGATIINKSAYDLTNERFVYPQD